MKILFKNITFIPIFFLSIYGGQNVLKAQESYLDELTIGDTISYELTLNLFNAKSSSGSMKEFRGKWLILDFWETYCVACINAMPKYNKLNKKFSDRLEIVPVTQTNAGNVKAFMERSPVAKETDFSFIVDDTVLNRLFPHRIIPHEVWIDPDGVVRAITGGQDVSEENIAKVILQKGDYNLTQKKDKMDWSTDRERDTTSLLKSRLYQHLQGAPSGSSFKKDGNDFYRAYIFNAIPLKIYYYVFARLSEGYLGNINEKRVIIDVKDTLVELQYAYKNHDKIPFHPKTFPFMKWKTYGEWARDNLYSYDIEVQKATDSITFMNRIFNELNGIFPIKGKVEKRETDCWLLKQENNSTYKLRSVSKEPSSILNNTQLGIINKPIREFLNLLNMSTSMAPIIDETGIKHPIDIMVDFSKSNLVDEKKGLVINNPIDVEILKKALKTYGLVLVPAKKEVNMLIITDY